MGMPSADVLEKQVHATLFQCERVLLQMIWTGHPWKQAKTMEPGTHTEILNKHYTTKEERLLAEWLNC